MGNQVATVGRYAAKVSAIVPSQVRENKHLKQVLAFTRTLSVKSPQASSCHNLGGMGVQRGLPCHLRAWAHEDPFPFKVRGSEETLEGLGIPVVCI